MGYEPSSLPDCAYNASKIELGIYHTFPIPSLYLPYTSLPHPLCSSYVLIVRENVVQWFKEVVRRKVDLRRLTAICGGDRILARRVAVRGLRELADDLEDERD